MDASAGSGAAGGESLLGRLPRSRPGQRSDKRLARTDAAARPRAQGGPTPAAASSRDRGPTPASGGGALAPIGAAAHLTGRAARLGLDIAGGVLKRLLRP